MGKGQWTPSVTVVPLGPLGSRRARRLRRAILVRSAAETPLSPPVVTSSEFMNDTSPTRIVRTLHVGFHSSGWKSDMDMQMRRPGSKRPVALTKVIPGGDIGKFAGNKSRPWKSPPS